jgi:hypothetical protein
MTLTAISLKQANDFVAHHHRHHRPVVGWKFGVGASVGETLVGVAICGRPVSRHLDNGSIIEVLRLCSDGTPNVCSFLYSACARAAKSLGYRKIITYILDAEPGTSLRAAGWSLELQSAGGGNWNCESRPRDLPLFDGGVKYPICKKQRWSKVLCETADAARSEK